MPDPHAPRGGGTGAADELLATLRALHLRAGKPSARALAKIIGDISHTTVNDILNGTRTGSWKAVSSLGRHLSGDEDDLRVLWTAAQEASPAPRRRSGEELWDPFHLDRVVVTAQIRDRTVVERTTERWVTATRDDVDRFVVRTALTNSTEPGAQVTVDALLNCTVGDSRDVHVPSLGSAQVVDILLPRTLNTGDTCFFATRTRNLKPAAGHVFVNLAISGHGAETATLRLQFAPDSLPAACWTYRTVTEIDKFIEPPARTDQHLELSEAGFVEHTFSDVPPAVDVGITWRW